MTKNNVTPISKNLKKSTVTLEDVLQALKAWRDSKTPNQRTIPSEICVMAHANLPTSSHNN